MAQVLLLPGIKPHCPFLLATGRGWVFLHPYSLNPLLRVLSQFFLPHQCLGSISGYPARLMIDICAKKKCSHSRSDFEKPIYEAGPELASENLIFGRVLLFPELIRVAYCTWTVYANSVVYTEYLLSFLVSGILECARGCLCDYPNKNSEHWVSHELPSRQHFTYIVTTHC